MLRAYIEGVGLLGPGLDNWNEGARILGGDIAHAPRPTEFPPASPLPPSERRRASRATRLVLAIGHEAIHAAGRVPSALATVFASSAGDCYNCHEICRMLASEDRQLSPTRFHNSVHNAPAGYWSIASGSMAPSSVIAAYDASFGAGLLEAMAQVAATAEPSVLVAYDTDYPQPLRATRPVPDSLGIALVLAATVGERSLASIELTFTTDAAEALPIATLEHLRRVIPAARGLPLLRALALGATTAVVIDYLDDRRLSVAISPCR